MKTTVNIDGTAYVTVAQAAREIKRTTDTVLVMLGAVTGRSPRNRLRGRMLGRDWWVEAGQLAAWKEPTLGRPKAAIS